MQYDRYSFSSSLTYICYALIVRHYKLETYCTKVIQLANFRDHCFDIMKNQ